VNYRNGCLAKSREIRERPVPEWKCCVVYNPITRKLIKLNLNAWLIFELCSDRQYPELEKMYLSTVMPKMPAEVARRQLRDCLDHLLREGLVEVNTKRSF
jgi:hypothetical protein